MAKGRAHLGRLGEQKAGEYLQKQGYQILERNFRTGWGEIDIIARDNQFLVFVEVKTRLSKKFGIPEEAITPVKLATIKKMAEFYQTVHCRAPVLMRIDVIAIEVNASGKILALRHLKNI